MFLSGYVNPLLRNIISHNFLSNQRHVADNFGGQTFEGEAPLAISSISHQGHDEPSKDKSISQRNNLIKERSTQALTLSLSLSLSLSLAIFPLFSIPLSNL